MPEIVSAAVAASTARSREMSGRMPCVEYSCVKVATPAKARAMSSRRYSRLPRGCPPQPVGSPPDADALKVSGS